MHEQVGQDPFWEFFEDKPDYLGEEEGNKLWGLVGIIIGHLASAAVIIGHLYGPENWFRMEMSWWEALFIALQVIVLGFQIWGLIVYIHSDDVTNMATVFRAWRTNLVVHGFNLVMQTVFLIIWLVSKLT